MRVEVPLAILYAVALLGGLVLVLTKNLDGDALWGAVLALIMPSPIYKSPQRILVEDPPAWARKLEKSLEDPLPTTVDTNPATPVAIRASQVDEEEKKA